MVKDAMYKTLLLGLGALALTREKAEDLIQELVKKGEVSSEQGRTLVNDLVSRADDEYEKVNQLLNEKVREMLEKLGTPSREDVERLERRIQILEDRLRAMEEQD